MRCKCCIFRLNSLNSLSLSHTHTHSHAFTGSGRQHRGRADPGQPQHPRACVADRDPRQQAGRLVQCCVLRRVSIYYFHYHNEFLPYTHTYTQVVPNEGMPNPRNPNTRGNLVRLVCMSSEHCVKRVCTAPVSSVKHVCTRSHVRMYIFAYLSPAVCVFVCVRCWSSRCSSPTS
jgi:hypothetical protein